MAHIRSKRKRAERLEARLPSHQSNGIGSLRPPYSRCDLTMIQRAINQRWPVPEQARRLIAEGVLLTRDKPGKSGRAHNAAVRTLILIQQSGWIQ